MTKPDPSVKPKYRQRKGRSNGFVEYKGKRITIPGAYGSEEGRANYEQWLENVFYKDGLPRYEPVSKPESLNVSQLLLKYLRYAKSAISDSEFSHTKVVLRIMHQQFAAIAIVDFGPKRLKLLQEALVRRGNARSQVNSQIRRVLTMFEWGVSEELVKVDVLQALRTVKPLKSGQTAAADPKPVVPVSWNDVFTTLAELSDILRAMVILQWVTGARSSNICQIRPEEIDRRHDIWVWEPTKHKTDKLGKSLRIHLGQIAQVVLKPYLDRDSDSYCFSPKETMIRQRKKRRENRTTKMSPSHKNRRASVSRLVTDCYKAASYRRAIRRAATRAGVEPWHPHQLRHTRSTEIRQHFGIEHAQAYIGHASISAAQIYAETNERLAIDVARVMG